MDDLVTKPKNFFLSFIDAQKMYFRPSLTFQGKVGAYLRRTSWSLNYISTVVNYSIIYTHTTRWSHVKSWHVLFLEKKQLMLTKHARVFVPNTYFSPVYYLQVRLEPTQVEYLTMKYSIAMLRLSSEISN